MTVMLRHLPISRKMSTAMITKPIFMMFSLFVKILSENGIRLVTEKDMEEL